MAYCRLLPIKYIYNDTAYQPTSIYEYKHGIESDKGMFHGIDRNPLNFVGLPMANLTAQVVRLGRRARLLGYLGGRDVVIFAWGRNVGIIGNTGVTTYDVHRFFILGMNMHKSQLLLDGVNSRASEILIHGMI